MLPASDKFTAADGTALTTYSSNWTNAVGTFTIYSNAVSADTSVDSLARWSADTFQNDQYAQVRIAALGSTNSAGAGVRITTNNGYLYESDSARRYFGKVVAGTYSDFAAPIGTPGSVNDIFKITAIGTTITPIRNGATDSSFGAVTDSSIASGYGGITGYASANTSLLDDWEGGDIATKMEVYVDIWRVRSWTGLRM
jgi:hypothetical protein